MKEQTYITCLESADGQIIDFERWAYKRAQTCINRLVELYSGACGAEWLYKQMISQASEVACYAVCDNKEEEVWRVKIEEFQRLIGRVKEERIS